MADVEAHGIRYSVVGEPGDALVEGFENSGRPYERGLLDFLRPLVSRGDCVIDVGANIGNHSLYLCLVCEAKVHAFEPNPIALRHLYANIQANSAAELISVHPVGLGADRSVGSIVPGSQHNLGAARLQVGEGQIPVETIDSFEFENVALIKIDVEGSEVSVLAGAHQTIATSKPLIVAESRTAAERDAVGDILKRHGYVRLRKKMASSPTYIYFPSYRAMVSGLLLNLPRMGPNLARNVLRQIRDRLTNQRKP